MRATFFLLFTLHLHCLVNGQVVHLKTGNFSVKHTDFSFNLGSEVKIARVYNSTSNYRGIFGWGWSFDYTKSLSVSPDGSLVTKECECEGKTNNIFKPASFDETVKSAAIEKIAEVVQAKQAMNADELFSYKQKLIEDRNFFIDEWQRLIKVKLLEPYKVPVGTRFVSKTFSYEVISKTSHGYESRNGGTKRYYNKNGDLIKEVSGKKQLFLNYDADQQLIEITDELNNKYVFQYKNGLVTQITASGTISGTIKYRYKNEELVATTNDNNNEFTYSYSNDGSHQLESIRKTDEVLERIYYHPGKKGMVLANIGYKDSAVYEYRMDLINDKEYSIEGTGIVFKVDDDDDDESTKNKLVSYQKDDLKKSIFYVSKVEDGFHFNYRTVKTERGVTEDFYNNEEGYPDKIVKNGDTTFLKYNEFGEAVYKENALKRQEVGYDPVCGKMTEYKYYDKYANTQSWSKFDYNADCNLVSAENSEGSKVELKYDSLGKIIWMKDGKENKVLTFQYNEFGKPKKIAMAGVGVINVTYSPEGEIKKVDAGEKGQKMALQVTTAFQNLLTVIKVDALRICKCSN